jgi:hypothetical protein
LEIVQAVNKVLDPYVMGCNYFFVLTGLRFDCGPGNILKETIEYGLWILFYFQDHGTNISGSYPPGISIPGTEFRGCPYEHKRFYQLRIFTGYFQGYNPP